MDNAKPAKTQTRIPLQCLNPAYGLFYPLIERAVNDLIDSHLTGKCPSMPALLSKLDLATRVYYDPSSRFPYVRETCATNSVALQAPEKRAALVDVVSDNLTVLMVRGVIAADHAVALVVLAHLDAEMLQALLEQSHVNTLDYARAKTLLIGTVSRRHDETLWQSLDDTINNIG